MKRRDREERKDELERRKINGMGHKRLVLLRDEEHFVTLRKGE